MKNLSIVINVVLAIAVIVLYVFHFSTKEEVSENDKEITDIVDISDLPIAYVNTDSVLKNYTFSQELQKDLENKQKKAEQNLQTRATGLQREFTEFQNNYRTMTQNQAMAVQENLEQKRQNLMMYEQTLRQELAEEEVKMTDELYTKLTEYLKDFGSSRDLKLVLTYTRGSGVLFANDSMDITSEVIEGLNTEHEIETSNKSDSTATSK